MMKQKGSNMKLWPAGKICCLMLLTCSFGLYLLAVQLNLEIADIPMLNRIPYISMNEPTLRNTTKTILFWNTMFDDENFYFGKEDVFQGCPVNDCYATHRRKFRNLEDFHAILFHGNDLSREDLPRVRDSNQWYVFVNLESPESRPLQDKFYLDYFNLTMTYRLNSDVPWTYGVVKEINGDRVVAPLEDVHWMNYLNCQDGREANGDVEGGTTRASCEVDKEEEGLIERVKRKSRPVAWFVSNCNPSSGRFEYVQELSRHVDVDVYGSCGDRRCPRTRDCLRELVEPRYFFYLSFENSLCQDYVTEKLYNPLRYNVVPIVYGGANYSRFAPTMSYVNALDFPTPKELAIHLKRLMQNSTEYLRHFRWKRYYRIDSGTRQAVCNLCKFLHRKEPRRSSDSPMEWYTRDPCPMQRLLTKGEYATKGTLDQLRLTNRHSDPSYF